MQHLQIRLVRIGACIKEKLWSKQMLFFLVFSLPIFVYCAEFLFTGNLLAGGDADYLIQTQEAMRRSVLEFHQFPWWNPWVSGGVPLFANPQFGLISVLTPFVLVFGSVVGYKIGLFVLFLVGFWGLYRLFRACFNTPLFTALMLAYIWTFGTFLAHRLSGHFTFFTIQLFPWALMYYLRRKEDKHAWLKFSLVISFMALSAAHNTTIMAYVVLGAIFLMQSVFFVYKKKNLQLGLSVSRHDLMFWAKAGAVFLVLTGYRLFLTLQYLRDFPRELHSPELTVGILKAIAAMFAPVIQYGTRTPSVPEWSWMEVSAYIGLCTGLAAALIVVIWVKRRRETSKLFSISPYLIGALLAVFFLLGLGNIFGDFSPYFLLRELPVLSSMRVATRWLAWCSLFVLIFIAAYRGRYFRTVINVLLLVSVVELFVFSRPHLAKPYIIPLTDERSASAQFEQKRHYNTGRAGVSYDENFTDATRNNYGQIIGGDSLVDTRFAPPFGVATIRCSIDENCPLVMTPNAKLVSWSPNRIVLERTGPGAIKLNTNPGRYWTINGHYTFLHLKTADPAQALAVNTPEKNIVVEYVPKYSPEWLVDKLR